MNRIAAMLLLVVFAACAAAQVRSGATVYIEPMNGYENYLAAAFAKKHVPLSIVIERSRAEYVLTSTVGSRSPNVPVTEVNTNGNAHRPRDYGDTEVSVRLTDRKSAQVVFAHSSSKNSSQAFQSTAEDCAKHLREFIEKGK